MEALALDHVDLTVGRLSRSIPFYTTVLTALGFSRVDSQVYVAWSNGRVNIGLREASVEHADRGADRTVPGLHHLALRARARADVDELYDLLQRNDFTVLDAPRAYPEYGPAYYAVYFADPDGLKLEFVHFPWGYWKQVQTQGSDERPRYRPR